MVSLTSPPQLAMFVDNTKINTIEKSIHSLLHLKYKIVPNIYLTNRVITKKNN